MRRVLCVIFFLALQSCASNSNIDSLKELREWRITADKSYSEKDYTKALQYYKKVSEVLTDDAEIWFRIGNTYNRLGRYDDALEAYKETLVRDSTYSKAWYNSGLIELKKAANLFHESSEHINPDDPIYEINQFTKEELISLVKRNNALLNQALQERAPRIVDPDQVEVIVLDNKPKKSTVKKTAGKKKAQSEPMDDWFAPLKMENMLSVPKAE